MNNRIPPGRILPPQFKEHQSKVIELAYQWRFTWKQRFQILCGYHMVTKFEMHTEHSPGRIEAKCGIEVTGRL